jgi:hypothetical protein
MIFALHGVLRLDAFGACCGLVIPESRLLPLIANFMPLLDCVCKRFIGFADSCVNSEFPVSSLSSLVMGLVLFGCLPSLAGIFIFALNVIVLHPKI